jgi:hypothetical protein
MPSNIDSVDRNQAPAGKSGNDISVKSPETAPGSASLPSLSLPNGGGAIRGIGEKFAANPVTGTGSLTVPVYTSPGRSGFGPQLSLTYDSGSGTGSFSFGWSLALAALTRDTDTRDTDKGLRQIRGCPIHRYLCNRLGIADSAPWGRCESAARCGPGHHIDFRILSEFLPNLRRTFAVVTPYACVGGGYNSLHYPETHMINAKRILGIPAATGVAVIGKAEAQNQVIDWLQRSPAHTAKIGEPRERRG